MIGGGDFSLYRIIPDYFRAFKNKKLFLRYPNSIRPWQHVIEPLYGYILLLMKLHKKKEEKYKDYGWNFGPKKSNNKSVSNVISIINSYFNNCIKIVNKFGHSNHHYESEILMLNSTKSEKLLKWKSKYDLNKSVKLIAEWYKNYLEKKIF